MTRRERDRLFRDVQQTVCVRHPQIPLRAACYPLAVHGALALREHGLRAVLQAGSLSWPRIDPRDDDGVSPTHFSYVWSPRDAASRAAVRARCLPEMHVWIALPDTQQLVDFSTGTLPAQCRHLTGYDWPGPLPPPYVWAAASAMPVGVVYVPDVAAIQLALALVPFEFGDDALRVLLSHERRANGIRGVL